MGHELTTDLEEPPENLESQGFGVDIDLLGTYNQMAGTLSNVLNKGIGAVNSA